MNARGGSKIKLLIALAFTAALVLAGIRIVPVYVSSYEFRDAIRQQARFAGVDRKSPEAVREDLFKKARELNLPVQREQIQVSGATGGVQITVRYRVPVDLMVYKTELPFEYQAKTGETY